MQPPSPGRRARRTRRRSEDFGAPGMPVPSKQCVRAHESAVLQLLGATGSRERRERDAAEIGGAERLRRELDIAVVLGALRRACLELPSPLVPRTELVVHLE